MSEADLYKFMLAYQREHKGEEIPPTLQQMADGLGLSKGMVFYYLQGLRKQGLVEKRPCGSRKYVAVKGADSERSDTHDGAE